ncbi:MAG TPA: F0F1 ATP synthase subunit B [Longimicrobium sp.]|jgi:F-type H+-transporting ATPase subunit b|nr:F0F1 ATP synthase subunit B [Longimicrobium sp.]
MRRSLISALALIPASAAPLFAQEHEKGGLLSVNTGLSAWTIIIFLIVLAILAKFAFPKILGAVEERERHLAELAEAAERDRAEAAALVEEHRRLVEETRARVQEALGEARNTAERMRSELMEQARREHDELLARGRAEVANERAAMLEQVRRDAAELAMRAAEKLVRRSLDAADNRRLVEEYLAQVVAPAARA